MSQSSYDPNLPINLCCYCNDECNPASQCCGRCARDMTMYSIGMKPYPAYLIAKEDSIHIYLNQTVKKEEEKKEHKTK